MGEKREKKHTIGLSILRRRLSLVNGRLQAQADLPSTQKQVLRSLLSLPIARYRTWGLGHAVLDVPDELARLPPRLVATIFKTARQRPDNASTADHVVLVGGSIHIGVNIRRNGHVVPDQPLQRVGILRFMFGEHLGLRLGSRRRRQLHVP